MNYTHDTFRIPTLAKVGKCMLKLCLAMAIRKSSRAHCLRIEYPRLAIPILPLKIWNMEYVRKL
jgi:hypothetical protein